MLADEDVSPGRAVMSQCATVQRQVSHAIDRLLLLLLDKLSGSMLLLLLLLQQLNACTYFVQSISHAACMLCRPLQAMHKCNAASLSPSPEPNGQLQKCCLYSNSRIIGTGEW